MAHGGAGGMLRSIVYGFNDGLTANFGLVAGIVGATVAPHIVIITGVAGALADALVDGNRAATSRPKSEREVHAHQIAMERDEMAPDAGARRGGARLIYGPKGRRARRARETAPSHEQDPAQAAECDGSARSNIHPRSCAPRTASSTATATGGRRLHPDAPFSSWITVPLCGSRLAVSMRPLRDRRGAQPLSPAGAIWASGATVIRRLRRGRGRFTPRRGDRTLLCQGHGRGKGEDGK